MAERMAHWEGVHTTKSIDDVSWWQPAESLWTDLITNNVGTDASVLDVGAGSGLLADQLLALGFSDVAVCDISTASLERVRTRLSDQVTYFVGDVTDLRTNRHFDVWFDRAVFHFLTDAHDIAGYRASLLRNTHPGSLAIIATFAEDGPKQCSGLDVARYSVDALAQAFAPECMLLHAERRVHTTPWGSEQPFSIVVLTRGA